MLTQPEAEGDPRQHLRRHHEVRRDRRGRRRRGEGRSALKVPLVVRLEGHQRRARHARSSPSRACRSSRRRTWRTAAREGRRRGAKGGRAMSILVDKNTKVITQGITGKTGQFHTRMCREYANGTNCFVAGVTPKKAGEDFEGIPIFDTVKDAKAATGATVSRDLRAAAVRRRRDRRGGRRRARARHLHHRGHPGARHDPHALPDAGQEDAAARAQLPRRHHARRAQDRHHARPHPPARAASASCRARARSPTRRSAS